MINEKGLLAAMKKAYRSLGYEVCAYNTEGEKRYFINAAFWCVDISASVLPRKILSLMVEHIGEILNDRAVKVSKAEGVQTAIEGVALAPLSKLNTTEGADIKKTQLTYNGYEVWQVSEDLRIVLLDYDYRQIISSDEVWHPGYADNKVIWWDGETTAAVARIESSEKIHIDALERHQWC